MNGFRPQVRHRFVTAARGSLALGVALAALSLLNAPARAQQLVTNGGFETGNLICRSCRKPRRLFSSCPRSES